MTFLESFEERCRSRGEAPSHALDSAGVPKSLYQYWKRNPKRTPSRETIIKLASYFGCSFHDLDPEAAPINPTSKTMSELVNLVTQLSPRDQEKILKYVRFTYGDDLHEV